MDSATQLHLIISPNEQMLCHTSLFLKSFLRNSGLNNIAVNLTVGPKQLKNHEPFRRVFPELEINQYHSSLFDPPYLGGMQRWDIHTGSELSIFVDVDVITCGSIVDVCNICLQEQKVMGVRNIGSPFRFDDRDSRMMWDKIARAFNIEFEYVNHLGCNISQFDQKHFHVPSNYVNYGFVLVPKKWREIIRDNLYEFVVKTVETFGSNFWNGEIAFCVALNKLQVPVSLIDIKYNYPDRMEFFSKSPCDDIRILHMVRKTIKKKGDCVRLLSSSDLNLVESFVSTELSQLYKMI